MQKLKELILFIAANSETDVDFGATKLNKILYYSDFLAYRIWGQSITGEEYRRLAHGPVPVRLVQAREELRDAGSCALQYRDRFGMSQQRVIALRAADLGDFSGREIALVQEVIRALDGASGREVSELTHQLPGWKAARDREVIPYETVFVSDRPLSAEEKAYAKTITASCA
jgi:hypothetical protein